MDFGNHIVFVDESGDHGLARVDPDYPMFVLAFCMFSKEAYVGTVTPAVQRLKLRFWGHDEQVLHEREIRKPNHEYAFMFDPERRAAFHDELNRLVADAPFTLVASAIRKLELKQRYGLPGNPYELALQFGMERICRELRSRGESNRVTHIVVERRGKREDDDLELAFRRIRDGANYLQQKLPLDLVMVSKLSNSPGLQFADLLARPIGIKVLRPTQANRAWDILESKFRRDAERNIAGWGLKVFP